GLFTAVANGETTVTARAEADETVFGTATATVRQEVFSIEVEPESIQLSSLEESIQVAAEPLDSNGNPVSDASLEWSSSNPSIATVDPSGRVTAVAAGEAVVTVTASVGAADASGATASSAASAEIVVVVQPVIASVTLTPASAVVPVDGSVSFSAEARDALGHALDAEFNWSSSDADILEVSSSGTATGRAVGSAEVTARAGDVSGSATVVVVAPDLIVSRLEVLPEGEPGDVISSPNVLFEIDVENSGSGASSPSTLHLLVVDAETDSPVGAPIPIGFPGIPAGGTATVSKVPPELEDIEPPPALYFRAIADGPNQIRESQEGNNTRESGEFTVPQLELPLGFTTGWLGGATGAESDWNDSRNWSTGAVPSPTDHVYIPVQEYPPVIGGTVTVADLLVDDGADLQIQDGGVLNATGDVSAGNTISGNGELHLSGSGTTLRGSVPTLVVLGEVALLGQVLATGSIVVEGSLDFGGHVVEVDGNFTTQGVGIIDMTSGGYLLVRGDAQFGGGGTDGLLSSGGTEFHGNFVATGARSFAASGGHYTAFDGSAPQTVSMDMPGASGQRFNTIDFGPNNPSFTSVTLLSNIHASGFVDVFAGTVDGGFKMWLEGRLNAALGGTWEASGVELMDGASLLGTVQNLEVTGAASLAGTTDVMGDLTVHSGGSLDVKDRTLTVGLTTIVET
ncbi:MAG: Ig-like domain-containing protein, partial [Halobacteriales archaeon]|nr:Ig-like domain-containing protein [Halobacteriales archaeon]